MAGKEAAACKMTSFNYSDKSISYTPEDLTSHHGIAAVITNEKGEILMQEHVKYGFWTIPIGKVRKGQGIIEGLTQELFEECDILVEECKELTAKDFSYIRSGKPITVFGHIFAVVSYAGTICNKEPHNHTTQRFMSLQEIQHLPFLSDLTLLYLEHKGIYRAKCI